MIGGVARQPLLVLFCCVSSTLKALNHVRIGGGVEQRYHYEKLLNNIGGGRGHCRLVFRRTYGPVQMCMFLEELHKDTRVSAR